LDAFVIVDMIVPVVNRHGSAIQYLFLALIHTLRIFLNVSAERNLEIILSTLRASLRIYRTWISA